MSEADPNIAVPVDEETPEGEAAEPSADADRKAAYGESTESEASVQGVTDVDPDRDDAIEGAVPEEETSIEADRQASQDYS